MELERLINIGQTCMGVRHENHSQTHPWIIKSMELAQWTFQQFKVR